MHIIYNEDQFVQVEGIKGELSRDFLKGKMIRRWSYVDKQEEATTYSTEKLADLIKYKLGNFRWFQIKSI